MGCAATRDLQLVGLVPCLCYRVFCGLSWRKEVVASYLSLSVVSRSSACFYRICTVGVMLRIVFSCLSMQVGGWARLVCFSGVFELNMGLLVGSFSVLLACYGVLVYGPMHVKEEQIRRGAPSASE